MGLAAGLSLAISPEASAADTEAAIKEVSNHINRTAAQLSGILSIAHMPLTLAKIADA